jgi:hypothetical protein
MNDFLSRQQIYKYTKYKNINIQILKNQNKTIIFISHFENVFK